MYNIFSQEEKFFIKIVFDNLSLMFFLREWRTNDRSKRQKRVIVFDRMSLLGEKNQNRMKARTRRAVDI